MSICVEGHIPSFVDVDMVADYLTHLGNEDIVINCSPSNINNYSMIGFYNPIDGNRNLNYHQSLGVFNNNMISLNAFGQAEYIIKEIVKQFGGIFVPSDCDNKAEIIQGAYSEANAIFVIRWALAKGFIHDTLEDDVIEAFRKFDEIHNHKSHQRLE